MTPVWIEPNEEVVEKVIRDFPLSTVKTVYEDVQLNPSKNELAGGRSDRIDKNLLLASARGR